MLIFFGGMLVGFLLVGFYLKIVLRDYQRLVEEGSIVGQKLENLLEHCQEISAQTIGDLEIKMASIENLLAEINQMQMDKIQQQKLPPTKSKKKPVAVNRVSPELSPEYLTIVRLSNAGWEVKDIAQEVSLGQDQIEMILKLFAEKS